MQQSQQDKLFGIRMVTSGTAIFVKFRLRAVIICLAAWLLLPFAVTACLQTQPTQRISDGRPEALIGTWYADDGDGFVTTVTFDGDGVATWLYNGTSLADADPMIDEIVQTWQIIDGRYCENMYLSSEDVPEVFDLDDPSCQRLRFYGDRFELHYPAIPEVDIEAGWEVFTRKLQ